MKRIVLCLSHSIEEYQQLQLLTEAGYEVFSIGGYINPHVPHDDKRPPLFDVPHYSELQEIVDSLGTEDNLGAAQSRIPDPILEWLGDDGVIIFHHLMQRLWGQWPLMQDWMKGSPERRVLWRSVGQTDMALERTAAYYRKQGLERVAYSPMEANIPGHAGYDALIRFWVDPEEWGMWNGQTEEVINVTQNLFHRGQATSPLFWRQATDGLNAEALGEGTPGGVMPLEVMKQRLKDARAYLYCGTRPASLTLGLLEALVLGIPVVSIGPNTWGEGIAWLPDVFEGHLFAHEYAEDPQVAKHHLRALLGDYDAASDASVIQRTRAIKTFGKAPVMKAWQAFLG